MSARGRVGDGHRVHVVELGEPHPHRLDQRGGQVLADEVGADRKLPVASVEDVSVPVGSLDVTMYRDDLRLKPARTLMPTDIPPGGIDGRRVILVDDVLFSGRTVRAALDAISDVGRPSSVQLAVLVDRGRRELPIQADYVGAQVETAADESVKVELDDAGAITRVVLRARRDP